MEDNVDARFNDAQFAIMASQPSSVEQPPVIPDQVNKDEISYKVFGSLAYEDNWPMKGDYDMNDLVMDFSSTVVKNNMSNKLTRTTTTFTPVNNGANYTNGVGFQLDNLTKNQVSSLTVSFAGNIISETLEAGVQKPVVILFNDIRTCLNRPFTVVMEFNQYVNGGVYDHQALPPYNPFIFTGNRSHEVHLPGYVPTSKMDESLRGTGEDITIDENGESMYYIARDNMPFALYISGSYFVFPEEQQDIRSKYLHFEDWVNSHGVQYADWYLQYDF